MFKNWIGSYIVAGLIYGFSQQSGFTSSTFGGLVTIVVALLAGFFYHKLKAKIKIKNETIRIIVTFIILEMVAGLLIGVLATVPALYLQRVENAQTDAKGWTESTRALYMKQNMDACGEGKEGFCKCIATYLMSKYSFEEIHNMSQDIRDNNASPQGIKDATNYCQTK